MPIESVAELLAELSRSRLLDPEQEAELNRDLPALFPDTVGLRQELLRRGWLTAYQFQQIDLGRGPELTLGQYAILDKLGEGGMGQVFKARHRRLDRIDALKVVRPEYLKNPDSLRRFHREARAAARLSHPNIVTIYDADEINGVHFLAMEYVEGTDLDHAVRDGGPLPVRQACEFTRQAALGLHHAHDRGMVHRDVKPSNLLLTADGGLVKVLDMGLARLESADESGATREGLTGSGAVMGTPDFMAPEQAINSHAVDVRADVYSLGCTLYFLLLGHPPFPTGSLTQKLLWHQQAEPAPLESERFDLPLGLAGLVRRMMAKKPDQRFQTLAEAAAALEPFARGGAEPVTQALLAADVGSATLPAARRAVPVGAASARAEASPPDHGAGDRAARTLADADAPATETTLHLEAPPPALRGKPKPPPATRSRGYVAAALGVLVGGVLALAVYLFSPWFIPHDDPKAPPKTAGELYEFNGHQDAVRGVAFAADGKRAVSAGLDHTVRVWDLDAGGQTEVQRHPGPVHTVAWSPKADRIVTAGLDKGEGVLRVWDPTPNAATPHRTLAARTAPILFVTVSPDGSRALTAGGWKGRPDGELRLWDLADGRELHALKGHTDVVLRAAFSPDGKRAASCGYDGTVRLWDLNKGEQIHSLENLPTRMLCVAFSPDGEKLLLGGEDAQLGLWDLKTYQQAARFVGHDGDVLCAAFTPDGRRVVSGGADHTVRVWDMASRRQLECFRKHADLVTDVAVSPDGRRALSCSQDHTVRLWGLPADDGAGP